MALLSTPTTLAQHSSHGGFYVFEAWSYTYRHEAEYGSDNDPFETEDNVLLIVGPSTEAVHTVKRETARQRVECRCGADLTAVATVEYG